MTYEEKKKLIESAKKLKEYCRYIGSDNCKGCLFLVSGFCELENVPNVWKIPKLSRWTPEDVALAKALKDIGVIYIIRTMNGINLHNRPNMYSICGYVRTDAFESLEKGCCVDLDTIIKEAEEENE